MEVAMLEYWIVDGPLDGEVVGADEPYDSGDVIEVDLTDSGLPHGGQLRFEVERPAQFHRPGLLRPTDAPS
jgi:hypothetical protein